MGLKDFADKHQFDTSFEGCRISGDKLSKGLRSWPIAGARAEFEQGANLGAHVTASRIVMTGVFALALKKNKSKVFVVVELADGEQMLIEAKVKQEKDARRFASKVNQASAHWATVNG